ncbi:MAG TPA: helix-turn-helix domain-containing protein, partial [Daejeonella sp.]|nr:helix-turn-helix domain-containing protein [Daejeonella sp.]
HTHKQTAVVAPTGVAAINAGGSTIHSFFQLPFNPYLPEKKPGQITSAVSGKNELISRVKINSNRKLVFQELELLIIDEISMVRCDTLDAIDVILRHFRYRPNEPFGGVQVLLIGDMFQLSPVARGHEWSELSQYYKSSYFFHSRVMMQQPPVYIELDKIYRQKNDDFIQVLNGVRNNNLSPEGYALLQKRFNPDFKPARDENYITLSTHNYIADEINAKELVDIPSSLEIFNATIKGEYPEKSYPLDSELKLKVGAKVMFIKNDLEKEKRYYNGKIGTIVSIDKDSILVQCPGESEPIIVSQYIWENVRYDVNSKTHLIDEIVIGTFQQYPLRLAWAITIHKSQGLTFEKAIIDAGKAFAPGQVYVALSRCTSLEGLVLMSPIQPGSLSNDSHIVNHSKSKPLVEETEKFLQKERIEFQKQLLDQLFDFRVQIGQIESLSNYFETKRESFNPEEATFIAKVSEFLNDLQVTAGKFQMQLQNLHSGKPELTIDLQKRLTAGSVYFQGRITELFVILNECAATTDSKVQAETFDDALSDLLIGLTQKQHLMNSAKSEFSVDEYYKARRSFAVPKFSVSSYSGVKSSTGTSSVSSSHPELLRRLQELRNEICRAKDLPVYIVASTATLAELTKFLPLKVEDLSKISGFGTAKVQTYGRRFLEVIQQYCAANGLESQIHLKAKTSKRKSKESAGTLLKTDTKLVSLQHYKSGKSIKGIAELRTLTEGTIQNHLASYIPTGEIKLEELVPAQKITLIKAAFDGSAEQDLNSLKRTLGDNFSYEEIRLVVNANKNSEN